MKYRKGPGSKAALTIAEIIGERIRTLRVAAGWSQCQLAAKIAFEMDSAAVTRQRIEQIESARCAALSLRVLYGICLAFSVEVSEVVPSTSEFASAMEQASEHKED